MCKRKSILLLLLPAGLLAGYVAIILARDLTTPRGRALLAWRRGNPATRAALVVAQREACPGAPFILPADGFVGLLYADPRGPYSRRSPHQGIDIFSEGAPGVTPVYAAYDGYITREADWKSTLIQRVPDDPLRSGRQIWLYYTHMADASGENDFIVDAFPRGTYEQFVEQGTLLGYTGNFSGSPTRTVWTHLHFSVIHDDGKGGYTNELDFANSIDPSLYLGRAVNYSCEPAPEVCEPSPGCA